MPSKKKRGKQAAAASFPNEKLLVQVVLQGNYEAVARLLAAGADPNASTLQQTNPASRFEGQLFEATALVCAAATPDRLEAARLLLDAGADPSLADGEGDTALRAAAGRGHLDVVLLLLARGAAIDAQHPKSGNTAFYLACFSNQPECAVALARAGCAVMITGQFCRTGLQVAQARGHTAVVEQLEVLTSEIEAHGKVTRKGKGKGKGKGDTGIKPCEHCGEPMEGEKIVRSQVPLDSPHPPEKNKTNRLWRAVF
jgi:ankyrin repeat protein